MGGRGAAAALAALLAASGVRAEPAELTPVRFADLPGWAADDHRAAFATFLRSCAAIDAAAPALRPGVPAGAALAAACGRASALGDADAAEARAFFEQAFSPFRVGRGVLTGYYEPEVAGSLQPTAAFDTPLLARPSDLITLEPGETLEGLPANLRGGRRAGEGFEPYPTRAEIEDGALAGRGLALVYLDWIDAFFVHIQGSSRVRLPDGRSLRLVYDGRNGRPFAGIGRLLIERGEMTKQVATMASIRAWLAAHPKEGRELMRRNESYIFFKIEEGLKPEDGPLGGQKVPLTAGRSLAVDQTLWPYGLPMWIDGRFPDGERLRRLMIAQDTGSAIVGAARGDYFAGTGDAAGAVAGGMKQQTEFYALLPRPEQGAAP